MGGPQKTENKARDGNLARLRRSVTDDVRQAPLGGSERSARRFQSKCVCLGFSRRGFQPRNDGVKLSSENDIEVAKKILKKVGMFTPSPTSQSCATGDELLDTVAEVLKYTGWNVYDVRYNYDRPSLQIVTGDGCMVVGRDTDGKLNITNGDKKDTRLDSDAFKRSLDDGAVPLFALVNEIIRIKSEWAK